MSASIRTLTKLALYGLVAIIASAMVVVVIGTRRWDHATREIVDQLGESNSAAPVPRSLESLPEPVARYFRSVFTGELPVVETVRLTQIGQFRMSEDENSWRPFRATQYVNVITPGFVWDARIEMAPLIGVRVRDAYVGGRGTMLGKLLSVVTVVNEHDKEELASGALLRYLAEGPWFPTALLPRESLRWQAIDDVTAAAVLTDAGIEVAATFHFNDTGDIVGVSTERYREVDGTYVLTPWRGRFWSHALRDNTRIPLEGEVAWVLDGVEYPYWRGKIVERELGSFP